jgi:hypothetical protein
MLSIEKIRKVFLCVLFLLSNFYVSYSNPEPKEVIIYKNESNIILPEFFLYDYVVFSVKYTVVSASGTFWVDANDNQVYDSGEEIGVNDVVDKSNLMSGKFYFKTDENVGVTGSFRYECTYEYKDPFGNTKYGTGDVEFNYTVKDVADKPKIYLSDESISGSEGDLDNTEVSFGINNADALPEGAYMLVELDVTGSAIKDKDYEITNMYNGIPNNVLITKDNNSIIINIKADELKESDEDIIVKLKSAQNAIIDNTGDKHLNSYQYTIEDDGDKIPALSNESLGDSNFDIIENQTDAFTSFVIDDENTPKNGYVYEISDDRLKIVGGQIYINENKIDYESSDPKIFNATFTMWDLNPDGSKANQKDYILSFNVVNANDVAPVISSSLVSIDIGTGTEKDVRLTTLTYTDADGNAPELGQVYTVLIDKASSTSSDADLIDRFYFDGMQLKLNSVDGIETAKNFNFKYAISDGVNTSAQKELLVQFQYPELSFGLAMSGLPENDAASQDFPFSLQLTANQTSDISFDFEVSSVDASYETNYKIIMDGTDMSSNSGSFVFAKNTPKKDFKLVYKADDKYTEPTERSFTFKISNLVGAKLPSGYKDMVFKITEDDKVPVVTDIVTEIEILESADGNTVLFTPTVKDDDTNLAGISFGLTGSTDLRIVGDGKIQPIVGTPFDYDTSTDKVFDIKYKISDGSNSTEYTIKCKLKNTNDNAPVLADMAQKILSTNEAVDDIVHTCTYSDADEHDGEPSVNTFTWSITSGNDDGYFKIDNSGNIRIKSNTGLFDAEKEFTVGIGLSDGTNTAISKTISIKVPSFSLSLKSDKLNVDEGDNGQSNNIAFSIDLSRQVSNPIELGLELSGTAILDTDYNIVSANYAANKFTIPANSSKFAFTIKTIGNDKTEEAKTLKLKIKDASDGEIAVSEITVSIDNDDYNPVLSVSANIMVPEDTSPGSKIAKVSITDQDNSSFTCSIDNSLFTVNNNGDIFLSANADIEYSEGANIIVCNYTVSDGTNETKKQLRITITEVLLDNLSIAADELPIYINNKWQINELVCHLCVTDEKVEIDGYTNWEILEGNEEGYFAIDESSGNIFLRKMLPIYGKYDFKLKVKCQKDGDSIVGEIIIHSLNMVGIEDVKTEKEDACVYPNPSAEYFTIKSKSSKNLDIYIYNQTGKMVKFIKSYKTNSVVNHKLNRGLYFIRSNNSEFNDMKLIVR